MTPDNGVQAELEETTPAEQTRLQKATVNIWGGIALAISLGILAAVVILLLAGLRTLTETLLVG